jgi:ParB-like chromosome segregation protein Spo0J
MRERKPENKVDHIVNGACEAKTDHGMFSAIELNLIQPHPMNDHLYGPIDARDPDVKALARSIKELGVREPLVLTNDLYVLSGHRRRVAAKLAGLVTVPCRIESFGMNDERIPTLLATYNRQRVKTADAILREEVVLSNPEEAYTELINHRWEKAHVQDDGSLEVVSLATRRKRSKISKAKLPFLNAVIGILNEYKDYWPLTDRQIHYYLLNDPPLIHATSDTRAISTTSIPTRS